MKPKQKLTGRQVKVLCLLRADMSPYDRLDDLTTRWRTLTISSLRRRGLINGNKITQDGLDAIQDKEYYGIPYSTFYKA